MEVMEDWEYNYAIKHFKEELLKYRPKGKDREDAEKKMFQQHGITLEEAHSKRLQIQIDKKRFEERFVPASLHNLSQNIYRIIDLHGVSVRNLEETIGIANGSIRNWSKSAPSVDKVLAIANLFNVSMDDLFANPDFKEKETDDVERVLKSKSHQWVVGDHTLTESELNHLINTAKYYREPLNKED